MGDLVWFIIIGVIALGCVIFYLVHDAKGSPALAGMNEPGSTMDLAHEDAVATPSAIGSGWRLAGWILLCVGVVGLITSFFLDTSLPTYSAGLLGEGAEVVNLDLLFRKGVAIACSLAGTIVGLLCLATGVILQAVHTRAP